MTNDPDGQHHDHGHHDRRQSSTRQRLISQGFFPPQLTMGTRRREKEHNQDSTSLAPPSQSYSEPMHPSNQPSFPAPSPSLYHQHHHSHSRRIRSVFVYRLLCVFVVSAMLTTLMLIVHVETNHTTDRDNSDGIASRASTRAYLASRAPASIRKHESFATNGTVHPNTSSKHLEEISSNVSSFASSLPVRRSNSTSQSTNATLPKSHQHRHHHQSSYNNSSVAANVSSTQKIDPHHVPTMALFPPLPSSLTYLGVLLDAGRHYFPIDWIYELLHHLHAMNYNYLHFRLTDDQVWAINLTAFPNDNGPYLGYNARGGPVYSPQELKTMVRYAKRQCNITIVPEVNVPGHAGAWGIQLPGLVVACPNFACSRGYGVPLNLSHPDVATIVRHVLTQVVDIFDHPPYLHLGGDEVHMSKPCLDEAGISNITDWYVHSVQTFERNILQPIVDGLGYSSNQIIRWETTSAIETKGTLTPSPVLYRRTGKVIHFWQSLPSDYPGTLQPELYQQPYLASVGLYMDVLHSGNGYGYGYGDYMNAQKFLLESVPPFGIVVGTFELSVDFWKQRNVLGRLLAVRMGVSANDGSAEKIFSRKDFDVVYIPKCLAQFGTTTNHTTSSLMISNFTAMCERAGMPLVDDSIYQPSWKYVWGEWKRGLCDGLALTTEETRVEPVSTTLLQRRQANLYYWDDLLGKPPRSTSLISEEVPPIGLGSSTALARSSLPPNATSRQISHAGIALNLVQDPISRHSFRKLLESVQPLGFNIVQVRISDDFGQVVEWKSVPDLGYSRFPSNSIGNKKDIGKQTTAYYRRYYLEQMVEWARQVGIAILPEINLATNGGGWYKAGMLINCPRTLCEKGEGIALDVVNHLEGVLPVALAAIREMREVFKTSPFLHLGSDERRAAEECFQEAGYGSLDAQIALHRFECKLSSALSFIGVDMSHIIRWENEERTHYPNRTGTITQFTNEFDHSKVKNTSNAFFFGTVTVTDEMLIWDTFEATRRWVALRPNGLLLRSSSGQTPQLRHVVAFALAIAKPEISTQDNFQLAHGDLCSDVGCNNTDESMAKPKVFKKQLNDAFLAEACLVRTANVTVHQVKS